MKTVRASDLRLLAINIRKTIRAKGMAGLARGVMRRVFPPKPRMLPCFEELVAGRRGLEIGGPSPLFSRKGAVPIYPLLAALDNCNYGRHTVWEGAISDGMNFRFDADRPPGRQYIAEAGDLKMIAADSYDLVLSCHTIEHTANPLGAIKEWMRVLRPEGTLLLVVPHMEGTFDHRRPLTTIEHLTNDFIENRGEDDQTHLPEILQLHDFDRDLGTSDFQAFKQRSEMNLEYRCLHHHVFDSALVITMLDRAQLQIHAVEALLPFHIIVGARKLMDGESPDNQRFCSRSATWRQSSPFAMDRI